MKIGFIGFGALNSTLASKIKKHQLMTSSEERSIKTIKAIEVSNIEIIDSFESLSKNSDLLIVSTSPASSIAISQKYGKLCKGIYLDLNNISPKTSIEVSNNVNNFVDAAIIGSIENNPILYLSGKNAFKLKFLNQFIPVKIISDKIGDASRLKLLRSIYTKNLSLVLIEAFDVAKEYGLENELLDTIAITEGEKFKAKAISRINNTKKNSKRKTEELFEIIEYFNESDLEVTKSSYDKLKKLI